MVEVVQSAQKRVLKGSIRLITSQLAAEVNTYGKDALVADIIAGDFLEQEQKKTLNK